MEYLLTGQDINIKSASDSEGKTPRIDSGDKENELKVKVDLKYHGK